MKNDIQVVVPQRLMTTALDMPGTCRDMPVGHAGSNDKDLQIPFGYAGDMPEIIFVLVTIVMAATYTH
jgi:hypothetical protein